MKKVIGIPGWKVGENSFGCGVNYLDYINKLEFEARILMPRDELVDVDMVLLPGGPDLNPIAYGEVPGFHTSAPDLFRQFFYDKRLSAYIEAGVPVFGICLGFQQLAAFFGSKLEQNMIYHAQSKDRFQKAHEVYPTAEGTAMGYWPYKAQKMEVNSHHHQGVLVENLSDDLIPLVYASNEEYTDKDKGARIVEAFMHRHLPIAGVQWHPEEWFDFFTSKLIHELIERKSNRLDISDVAENTKKCAC